MTFRLLFVSLLMPLIAAAPCAAAQESITLASTTSTENSGLFDHILPLFEAETGIEVRVVAQGTGQALETGRRGDADVILTHAPRQEAAFVAAGYGVERVGVMYNDFVIVGPQDDPAGIAQADTAAGALSAIAQAQAPFVSRGDDSGTHAVERRLWDMTRENPDGASWYMSTGSGMGATLNTAVQVPAYTLSDRATWLAFANRGALQIGFEGDPALFNPYGVVLVNPDRHPHVNALAGQAFIDWLRSESGRAAIAEFRIDGEQLFFPDGG